jgi:hypothetical protein
VLAFKIRDRQAPDYHATESNHVAGEFPTRAVTRKGKMFDVKGVQLELFSTTVMAEAIDRTRQTLIDWERRGLFPKPIFQISTAPGQPGKKRLYASVQVLNLHRLMWNKYQCRSNHTFKSEEWFADVRLIFYRKILVVDAQGNICNEGV